MDEKKGEGITGVWQDLGFRLNLKLVLCQESSIFNQKLRLP
jgi:hypothetical protein